MTWFVEDVIVTVQLLRDDELVEGHEMVKDYVDSFYGRTWIPGDLQSEFNLNLKFVQIMEAELECRRLGI